MNKFINYNTAKANSAPGNTTRKTGAGNANQPGEIPNKVVREIKPLKDEKPGFSIAAKNGENEKKIPEAKAAVRQSGGAKASGLGFGNLKIARENFAEFQAEIPDLQAQPSTNEAAQQDSASQPGRAAGVFNSIAKISKKALKVALEAAVPLAVVVPPLKSLYDVFGNPARSYWSYLGQNYSSVLEAVTGIAQYVSNHPRGISAVVGGLFAINTVNGIIQTFKDESAKAFGKAIGTASELAGFARNASAASLALIVAANAYISAAKAITDNTLQGFAGNIIGLSAPEGKFLSLVLLVSVPAKLVIDKIMNSGKGSH